MEITPWELEKYVTLSYFCKVITFRHMIIIADTNVTYLFATCSSKHLAIFVYFDLNIHAYGA